MTPRDRNGLRRRNAQYLARRRREKVSKPRAAVEAHGGRWPWIRDQDFISLVSTPKGRTVAMMRIMAATAGKTWPLGDDPSKLELVKVAPPVGKAIAAALRNGSREPTYMVLREK